MKKLKQSYEIKSQFDGEQMLRDIEEFAKICYKSEHTIKEGSAKPFVKKLIGWKHESPLEHCSITVKFITDRGISHEIVRHRIAAYNQESTRYCVVGNTKITPKNIHQHFTVEDLFNEVENSKNGSWKRLNIRQYNEDTGELCYSKIKNVMYNGEKECYKLTTKLGYTLECTVDHKILTSKGYKELQELDIGDLLIVGATPTAHTDELINLESTGVQKVYDIEMDSDFHNFVANGIVVHNCNYALGKFDNEISVILSKSIEENAEAKEIAENALKVAEDAYMKLLNLGIRPEDARDVLPTCLKTEIVCTYNLREWRHIFKLRTSKAAHPKVRALLIPLLEEFKQRIPVLFDDIEVEK